MRVFVTFVLLCVFIVHVAFVRIKLIMMILLLISQGIRWRKWAPYLRLAGRGRCTASRPDWQAGRLDCGAL